MTVQALNFNQGAGLPFTIFAPVEWAPFNSSGVGNPVSSTPGAIFQSIGSFGTGITPDLLAASQANLAGISYTGLNTISGAGASSAAQIGSFFQNWGATLQSIAQQNANAFSESVNKSAKACSGFFSCLFG
jgi:hypothetical protein